MNATITRIGKIGVLGHLDELERLMREYCNELRGSLLNSDAVSEDLTRRLSFSGFLAWLRQRQRESVAGTATKGE